MRAEAGGRNLGQVLQLKEHFAVSAFAVAVNHRFAFFVVLRQRPRRNRLNVARAKTGTTVGVEQLAGVRLVQHGPDFQAFSEFPTTAMQHSAAPAELRWLALVACS